MVDIYKSDKVVKTKSGWKVVTDKGDYPESIDLREFYSYYPENTKGVNIVANSTWTGWENQSIYSSHYNDTITALYANHNIYLYGTGSKKVKTGDFYDLIRIYNTGKNTINLANGDSFVYIQSPSSINDITTGVDKDIYQIQGGTNKITDKGGENKFYINATYSKNNITLKGEKNTFEQVLNSTNTIKTGNGEGIFNFGKDSINNVKTGNGVNTFTLENNSISAIVTGSGDDTFNISLSGRGVANIKSGKGTDTLNITDTYSSSWMDSKITADLGDGVDYVYITPTSDTSEYTAYTDIKTGSGDDNVEISAGLINKINTGAGKDYIVVKNTTKTTSLSTIKAGNDSDTIRLNGGTSVVYGENGEDEITATGGINTIYGGSGVDTIISSGGQNIIYSGAGKDKIVLTSGTNSIYADGDIVSIIDGNNAIHTVKGGNKINVQGGTLNRIYLEKGNNTVNIKATTDEDVSSNADINITAGKNTINIEGKLNKTWVNSTLKNQTVNVLEGSSKNKFYGSDVSEIYNITGGVDNELYGREGNDIFNIKNGSNFIYGDEGNDIFNITGGVDNILYGGDGVDTFNIKGGGGSQVQYKGDNGDDIYNLYNSSSATIIEYNGSNTYNIKKGYSGKTQIWYQVEKTTDKMVFDKSYKLTNANNVKNDVITSNSSNVTIYSNYDTSDTNSFGDEIIFTIDVKNEIKDKVIDNDKSIVLLTPDMITTYNVGGKNYTLDLTTLKQELAGWFTGHSAYANKSTDYVLSNGSEADIQSLMAVYTKDTADCFIKI